MIFFTLPMNIHSESYTEFLSSGTISTINQKTCSILEKKYAMECNGSGGEFMNQVNAVQLHFNVKRDVTRSQARAMLIDCGNEYLKQVNSNQKIQKFLLNQPAEIENIKIDFMFKPENEDTDLYSACLSHSKLKFFYPDHVEVESLEEAQKILATQSVIQAATS